MRRGSQYLMASVRTSLKGVGAAAAGEGAAVGSGIGIRVPPWQKGRCLTVKLRGRTEAPDGAEGAQFLSAGGAKQEAPHGPLQRLLDRTRSSSKSRSTAS